ncbi:hypothetical protein GQ600_22321 [Phytophthora cactorum]|nr:hypothetical protein GQ600_22321 [Phytophthora cactorum]
MAEVYRRIYDLYFAGSEENFLAQKAKVLVDWRAHLELGKFGVTRRPFAPTNNPCETFNRAFKRDYTQKRKLKLAVLLQQMQYCCSHRSMASTEFEPRRTSDKRQSRAQQHFDVADISPSRNSISFLAHDASGNIVCELSTPPLHFYTPSLGRSEEALDVAAQFSANYARMKIDDLPSTGWPVDLEAQHYFAIAAALRAAVAATPSVPPACFGCDNIDVSSPTHFVAKKYYQLLSWYISRGGLSSLKPAR